MHLNAHRPSWQGRSDRGGNRNGCGWQKRHASRAHGLSTSPAWTLPAWAASAHVDPGGRVCGCARQPPVARLPPVTRGASVKECTRGCPRAAGAPNSTAAPEEPWRSSSGVGCCGVWQPLTSSGRGSACRSSSAGSALRWLLRRCQQHHRSCGQPPAKRLQDLSDFTYQSRAGITAALPGASVKWKSEQCVNEQCV